MTMRRPLWLQEEVLLLALRDAEGTIPADSMYAYAVGGAILSELLLAGRIAISGAERRLVSLVDREPLGEPVIDECLAEIAEAKTPESLTSWVSRLSGIRHLKHRVAEGLCQLGILRAEHDRVLLVFSRKTYPEADHQPEQAMVERLREAIFGDADQVDPRTAALLSLALSADMLKSVFDRQELEARRERVERVTRGQLVGEAAREAIEAMQMTMMMLSVNTPVLP